MSPLEQRAVLPFYLDMMGHNAIERATTRWPDLVAEGRRVSRDDVAALLSAGAVDWRPVVRGAWFSTKLDAADAGPALRAALALPPGGHAVPPLVTACVVVLGVEAVDELAPYAAGDAPANGSTRIIAAALDHLGASPTHAPTDEDRQHLRDLVDVGTRLRAALRD